MGAAGVGAAGVKATGVQAAWVGAAGVQATGVQAAGVGAAGPHLVLDLADPLVPQRVVQDAEEHHQVRDRILERVAERGPALVRVVVDAQRLLGLEVRG